MRAHLSRGAVAAALCLVISEVLAAGNAPTVPGVTARIPSIAAASNIPAICYTKHLVPATVFGGSVVKVSRRACFDGERPGSVIDLTFGRSAIDLSF